MNLEKVVLRNFKSYRGEYTIGPFDRFSSIIGPNGSGKSNILDAILFSMNVPTASLRVRRQTDLITEGESEMAVETYVCGHTFSRHVNIQGQAWYRCDGKSVTSGAYNEALEAINIFGKIKNFVICQGDIMRSDVDLLRMVEQVSGSIEYEPRYTELAASLSEATRELALQYERRKSCSEALREIKENKEKECEFNKLLEERDAIQRAFYAAEIAGKEREIDEVEKVLDGLRNETRDDGYEQRMSQLDMIRAEAMRIQKEYLECESELAYQRSRGRQPSQEACQRREAHLMECQKLRGIIGQEIKALGLAAEEGKESEVVIGYQNKLVGLLEEVNNRESELKHCIQNEEKRLSEITLENIDKLNALSQLNSRRRGLSGRIARARQRMAESAARKKDNLERGARLRREVEGLVEKMAGRLERYNQVAADEAQLESQYTAVMREILAGKARKNDAARRSAIYGVVESMRNIFSGVHGRVIDLVTPIQKKYELGIGVLLAAYDSAVVVENEQVALSCIRYMKEARACKLTFLPLSRLKNKPIPVPSNGEYLAAVNCVKCDPKFNSVVEYILGGSLLVDSPAIAKCLLYGQENENRRMKVCTLDGILFTAYGLITGGQEVKNKYDGNAMDELIRRRGAIVAELKAVRGRKEAFAEVEMAKERIAALEREISTLSMEASGPGEEVPEELERELGEVEEGIKALGVELGGFENERRRISGFVKRKELEVFAGVFDGHGVGSLGEYRERLARVGATARQCALLDELVEDGRGLMDGAHVGGDGVNDAVDLKAMESTLNGLHERLEAAKSRLRIETRALKETGGDRQAVNRRLLSNELLKIKLEEELKDLKQAMEIECGGNVEGQSTGVGHAHGTEELKAMLNALNRKLEDWIPQTAVDDGGAKAKYAAVNRDYCKAAEKAAALKKAYYEVKEARMGLFSACFRAVAAEVPAVYRVLSGADGAEANAYVVYEGDPFASNLRYYLMPPGKRFTEFHALSGGEKSIALLSFIFALNHYKPAPFYIFDEVDSALDKANVGRLTSYLVSSPAQFLIITLKQSVFQHSDSLVGVYKCPFQGKSRILTYRLAGE